jgi:hypothetical protein
MLRKRESVGRGLGGGRRVSERKSEGARERERARSERRMKEREGRERAEHQTSYERIRAQTDLHRGPEALRLTDAESNTCHASPPPAPASFSFSLSILYHLSPSYLAVLPCSCMI